MASSAWRRAEPQSMSGPLRDRTLRWAPRTRFSMMLAEGQDAVAMSSGT